MQLIASGAYCEQEFVSEFGRLPPSLLPVGNKRLYEHQVEFFTREEKVYLSLPESYCVSKSDGNLLASLGVEIILVPEGLSIGESIGYCINITGCHSQRVDILYGDTLVSEVQPGVTDVVGIAKVSDNYFWDYIDDISEGEGDALIGYFSFSDSSELVKSVSMSRGDFTKAVRIYSKECSALTPLSVGAWLDFGHLHTYFRSKASITTQRAFNSMKICPKYVVKASANGKKIQGEINWFEAIPAKIRVHTPHYLGPYESADGIGYKLEYLYLSTLSELFVFGELPPFIWRNIFSACRDFLVECSSIKPSVCDSSIYDSLYLNKTVSRLEEFSAASDVDLNKPWRMNGLLSPSLLELARLSADRIKNGKEDNVSLVHGDFCFSNILYDFRTQSIKVIDPRGVDAIGSISLFGDRRYDISKLAHSVIGLYDHIVAGRYSIKKHGDNDFSFDLPIESVGLLQGQFEDTGLLGWLADSKEILAILVQLFLAMLPLHHDRPDRQEAFVCNAIRLYRMMEEK